MLGAGVMAAGDVKIEGLIEDQESLIDKIREHDGVSFGIGCGETAALVTGTGDRATKHCACFVVKGRRQRVPAERQGDHEWRRSG